MTELNPIHGKNKILKFRLLEEAATEKAARLALQTEHSWNYSRDNESIQTKDGNISSSAGLEVTLDITAISSYDAVNDMLFKAVRDNKKLEVWEIDITQKGTETENQGKYKAMYAQGDLSEWALPNNVESLVELSTNMTIDGVPVEGWATLTPEDIQEIQAAYSFRDTTEFTG